MDRDARTNAHPNRNGHSHAHANSHRNANARADRDADADGHSCRYTIAIFNSRFAITCSTRF